MASVVSRLGYVVTVTFGNTKVIDLMFAHPDGRVVTIDVKGLKNTTHWPLKPKLRKRTHFYVLVSYRNRFADVSSLPLVYVIPSTAMRHFVRTWVGRPDVSAVPYSLLRRSKYRDAWNLLFKK